MKNKICKWMIPVCLVVFLAGGGAAVYAANSIDNAQSAKARLEQQKKDTDAKIAELKKEKGDILNYIEKLDKQMAELDTQIAETNKKIKKTEKKLTKTKKELKKAKEEEEKQYASMKKRIKYMYENGSSDYFELLLKAESVSDLLNRAEYIEKISAYDKSLLEKHQKIKEEIAEKERNLEKQAEEQTLFKEELSYEQSVVSDLVDEKNKELKKYNANIADASEEAKEYAKEIEKQEQLIEDLLEQERKRIEEEERRKEEERKRLEEERRRQEEANKAEQNNGENNNSTPDKDYSQQAADFRWPLNVSGRISSSFGEREQPTAGASTYHKGIDISVPVGTEIVAAAGGKVVTATYSSSAGNYIMIYHGNSTYTVYMHCSSLSVSVNEEVEKGQVIAAAGSTGISTGSHLHFGISVNGSYVNPLNYVSQ